MSILGNFKNYIEDDKPEGGFQIPEVAKKTQEELPLKKCLWISLALHPLSVFVFIQICLLAAFLGFGVFDRPEPKMRDIEFVLVDKEAIPINKNTRYRSDKNSRAGGKHDPKKVVSAPSASTRKSPTSAPSASSKSKVQKPVQKQTANRPVSKPTATQKAVTSSSVPKPTKVAKPTSRPSLNPPSAPKVSATQKAPIGLPAPPSYTPGKYHNSTGPVGGTSTRSNTLASGSNSSSSSRTLGSAGSAGSRASSGAKGNPSAGNPNGPFGIDALREPNFAPYMRELQSRIKYNWDPPKGNESKRVVLMFRIAKNGQLLSNKVVKSSGLAAADRAALNAVEITAPFRPLPVEFKGSHIDIQFTFDYNVFGATGY